MGGGVEVALAADIQAGVVVHVDELGAGRTFAIMVVQRLPGHEQLQELVAAGAQRADLRDDVGITIHRAEAGDATLHLALYEQVRRAQTALWTGILPLGVADIVDHHTHDAAIAAAHIAGKRVCIVGGQAALGGAGRSRRGLGSICRHGTGRCRLLIFAKRLLQPAGKAAAQAGIAGSIAAGQGHRGGCQPRNAKNCTACDLFHAKNLLTRAICAAPVSSELLHSA